MSGVGAYRAGGRWNSPGRYVVYAAGNLTLAMLELLVHIDDANAFRTLGHVYHAITIPDDAVSILEEENLPPGWASSPVSRASQVVGDEWLDASSSPVLAVPSVIVPPAHRYDAEYMNHLIDPTHPDSDDVIEVGPVLDLEFDARLVP
jgi:RES domain-containing protein